MSQKQINISLFINGNNVHSPVNVEMANHQYYDMNICQINSSILYYIVVAETANYQYYDMDVTETEPHIINTMTIDVTETANHQYNDIYYRCRRNS